MVSRGSRLLKSTAKLEGAIQIVIYHIIVRNLSYCVEENKIQLEEKGPYPLTTRPNPHYLTRLYPPVQALRRRWSACFSHIIILLHAHYP